MAHLMIVHITHLRSIHSEDSVIKMSKCVKNIPMSLRMESGLCMSIERSQINQFRFKSW